MQLRLPKMFDLAALFPLTDVGKEGSTLFTLLLILLDI